MKNDHDQKFFEHGSPPNSQETESTASKRLYRILSFQKSFDESARRQFQYSQTLSSY